MPRLQFDKMAPNCAIAGMYKPLAIWARCLSVALVLVAAGSANAATSPSLTGSYTGLLLISQGTDTRISATANVIVTGSKKAPTITVSGVLNSVAYTQTIKLFGSGKATVSTLLPGIAEFNQPVTGTVKGTKTRTITGFFDKTKPGGAASPGRLRMQIGKSNYNSTLLINSEITFKNNGTPVYVTIVAL